ncbi:MAG TPA: pyruvate formate lyase family protein [Syntrophales bacterium]|nr:pyruvate formate lyase family protein [Syntrophales bacterium]
MLREKQDIKSKLVIKAVRNVRRGYEVEEADRGMYRAGIKLDLQRSRCLTESYRETDGLPMIMRRARALDKIFSKMDIYIQDWERIVGGSCSFPEGLYFGIDMNWRSVKRIITGQEGKDLIDDAGRAELAEMVEYWKGKCMSDRQQELFTGDVLKYWKYEGTFLWTHWSELGIPNYEKIFRIGLKGIISEAESRLDEIDRAVPSDYVDQKEFLQSVIVAVGSVITFAHRYAAKAREMAKQVNSAEDRKRLEEIAAVCDWVPENPPRTLLEALQSFFFVHVARYVEYSTLGIGVRFDKLFGPYYENDLKAGRTSREEALELLQLLWVKLHELGLIYSPMLSGIYGGVESLQAITLGGVDENGKDITNDMTYLVLDTAETMRTLEPSIALRYHKGTPDTLLNRATEVLHKGIGYPSFFNDGAMIPTLLGWDVPLKDARDYAVTGCVYIEIPGKNIARRPIGGLILPKCLWWALHQGVHPVTKIPWGAATPDPAAFRSVQDVLDAYLEQVRFFFGRQITIEKTCRNLYAKYLPRPFYSAVLDGCIEQGKDTRQWAYPSMVHDFVVILGTTNVVDSLAAIQKVVFEEQQVTMTELIEVLDKNWDGNEELRQRMLRAPKYGNDVDSVDQLAAEVHHRTSAVLAEFTDRFGKPCRGDGSGVSATYGMALLTPATPDGRRDGEPFADGTLSPSQGRDSKGPTAVLKSAAKIDTRKTYNHLLNQKFLPSMLAGDMKPVFTSYLRTWGELGISHIQFNVIDKETLLDAQIHPENHQDLIVRVAGYSAYFVDLSRGLQDSIIARTEQSF